ncbi:TetR/AcrR family transcriptional regulator [Weissella diestrammenae]|uniref:TetR/AcrR family transcriptional regulator n=1 Tax=Weissella diestrammenae TaxID=1162633 RepID=A0A7G9T598_9LACO|nr:TetR/AcrR family transcriptional regulator [Weissella diestrammenae]MCM0583130.1 TetR/AcrR family transcriptional regulator [Weissella diestrammenae]QNN75273.1 TetR/AcrR family transcriptional regulator [Weissella diestrammenae]
MSEKILDDYSKWMVDDKMPAGKQKVLLAAIKLFAKYGYDGTSTASIAQESGMSEATIFKYFKTKRLLLDAVLDPLINQLIPMYADNFINHQLPLNGSFAQTINEAIRNRLAFVYTNRHILKILVSELMVNDVLLGQLKTKLAPIVDNMLNIAEQLGAHSDLDTIDILRLMTGQLVFEFIRMTRLAPTEAYDINTTADKIAQSVLRSLSD